MQRRTDPITFLGLLAGTLAVSTTFGMLLLLPLYVKEKLAGNEVDFGYISAAGSITTALAIGVLIRYPRRLPPHFLLSLTATGYALAAFAVSLTHVMSWPLVLLGILLGTTWAAAYTTAPMVASELSPDESRARNIGYVTGMVQIGFGLGPVVGYFLLAHGTSFSGIFRIAAVLSLFAAIVVFPLHYRSPELAPSSGTVDGLELRPALAAVLRSPAALPLLTILFCACLFTTMNSFQTTFALARGLSFNIFYVSYTLSVIFARFVLAPALRDSGSPRVVAVAGSGIVVSILLFLLVGRSGLLYGLASCLLGVTYGLTLPALQAGAVNTSAESYRPRVLPIAGLIFEVAILAFPLAAGAIITTAGYNVLFAVLVFFALVIASLGIWHARNSGRVASPANPGILPHPSLTGTGQTESDK